LMVGGDRRNALGLCGAWHRDVRCVSPLHNNPDTRFLKMRLGS
jgi:hypothetical protein